MFISRCIVFITSYILVIVHVHALPTSISPQAHRWDPSGYNYNRQPRWVTDYDTGLSSGNSESTALFIRPLQRQAFLGKSFLSKIGYVWSIHEYKDRKGNISVTDKDTAVVLEKIDELVDSGSWNDIPVMIMRGKGGEPFGMTNIYEQANEAQKKSLEEQVKKMTYDKVVSVAKKHQTRHPLNCLQCMRCVYRGLDILVTTSGSSAESVTILT
ncbi:hypothetical protein F5876DRAFT_73380 [Lentinula aff. lateritia]|uniref:Uncharacterized protein n=1 Tax=Lentinula aff. lateritia TaxID=2804960 RepID=A0ACC1UAZ6_9AGAR|nr:hypothetical protein F5876DRAFT_73380 [Lentinula aff. lateritia]